MLLDDVADLADRRRLNPALDLRNIQHGLGRGIGGRYEAGADTRAAGTGYRARRTALVGQKRLLRVRAQGADRKLIAGVNVFDVFEGASIGEGRKSVAIEVTIQPVERTLTDEDFEALAGRIVENVAKQTGGTLRG